ncbi:hypothetical protein ACHAW6_011181 [Cyclotella cf. meneghiniana]
MNEINRHLHYLGLGNICHSLAFHPESSHPLLLPLMYMPGESYKSRFPYCTPGTISHPCPRAATTSNYASTVALASLSEVDRSRECIDYLIARTEMARTIAIEEYIRLSNILGARLKVQHFDITRCTAQPLHCLALAGPPSHVDDFLASRPMKIPSQTQSSEVSAVPSSAPTRTPDSETKRTGETLKAKKTRSKLLKKSTMSRKARVRDDLETLWNRRYDELVEFHQANGHCNVPQRDASNRELGRWVKDQRTFKSKGTLTHRRIELLNKIGFMWRIRCHNDFWEERFKEMIVYKNVHGHCNASMSDPANSQLARWVDRQRRARKNGKISKDRMKQLDDIGFMWSVR